MKENVRLEKLSVAELEKMPKTRVTYFYVKGKNAAEVHAVMKLDARFSPQFKMSESDVLLLMQEHGLVHFNARHEFEKQYYMTKGVYSRGKKFQRPWYRIDLLVVPGAIIRTFLNKKEILYVQRDPKLDALFHKYVEAEK